MMFIELSLPNLKSENVNVDAWGVVIPTRPLASLHEITGLYLHKHFYEIVITNLLFDY